MSLCAGCGLVATGHAVGDELCRAQRLYVYAELMHMARRIASADRQLVEYTTGLSEPPVDLDETTFVRRVVSVLYDGAVIVKMPVPPLYRTVGRAYCFEHAVQITAQRKGDDDATWGFVAGGGGTRRQAAAQ